MGVSHFQGTNLRPCNPVHRPTRGDEMHGWCDNMRWHQHKEQDAISPSAWRVEDPELFLRWTKKTLTDKCERIRAGNIQPFRTTHLGGQRQVRFITTKSWKTKQSVHGIALKKITNNGTAEQSNKNKIASHFVPIFVISSQVLSVQSTKQYVPIQIAIFVHYAPKNGTCFTADVSEWKPNKERFYKVQSSLFVVLKAEVNRRPSSVAVQKVMSSALRSPVRH